MFKIDIWNSLLFHSPNTLKSNHVKTRDIESCICIQCIRELSKWKILYIGIPELEAIKRPDFRMAKRVWFSGHIKKIKWMYRNVILRWGILLFLIDQVHQEGRDSAGSASPAGWGCFLVALIIQALYRGSNNGGVDVSTLTRSASLSIKNQGSLHLILCFARLYMWILTWILVS